MSSEEETSLAKEYHSQNNNCCICGESIFQKVFAQLEPAKQKCHLDCIVCIVCKKNISNERTCFKVGKTIFCINDYLNIVRPNEAWSSAECFACYSNILLGELATRIGSSDEFVHTRCFKCHDCHRFINTGDDYCMDKNLIYCHHCLWRYNRLQEQQTYQWVYLDNTCNSEDATYSEPNNNTTYPSITNETFPHNLQISSETSKSSNFTINEDASKTIESSKIPEVNFPKKNIEDFGSYEMFCSLGRRKRPRTSFKHYQLRILKEFFTTNQNPVAKDFKVLSEQTGLEKRVLQSKTKKGGKSPATNFNMRHADSLRNPLNSACGKRSVHMSKKESSKN